MIALRTAMETNKNCRCQKMHKSHLCESRAKGRTHEIDKLIRNPNFVCGICGETAASEDDICLPVALFI